MKTRKDLSNKLFYTGACPNADAYSEVFNSSINFLDDNILPPLNGNPLIIGANEKNHLMKLVSNSETADNSWLLKLNDDQESPNTASGLNIVFTENTYSLSNLFITTDGRVSINSNDLNPLASFELRGVPNHDILKISPSDDSNPSILISKQGNIEINKLRIATSSSDLWLILDQEQVQDISYVFSAKLHGDYFIIGDHDYESEKGAICIYRRYERTLNRLRKDLGGLIEGEISGDRFGFSVDLNDDYALVGAPGPVQNNMNGAAYMLKKASEHKWEAIVQDEGGKFAGDSNYEQFGSSVSIGETFAIVGAPNNSERGNEKGAIYFFELKDDKWTRVSASAGGKFFGLQNGEKMGFSVAIDGIYAIVGAPNQSTKVGKVYFFEFSNDSWVQREQFSPDYSVRGSDFGSSVSISGKNAIVGDGKTNLVSFFQFNGSVWELVCVDSSVPYPLRIETVSIFGDKAMAGGDNDFTPKPDAFVFFRLIDNQWQPIENSSFYKLGNVVSIDNNYALAGNLSRLTLLKSTQSLFEAINLISNAVKQI